MYKPINPNWFTQAQDREAWKDVTFNAKKRSQISLTGCTLRHDLCCVSLLKCMKNSHSVRLEFDSFSFVYMTPKVLSGISIASM